MDFKFHGNLFQTFTSRFLLNNLFDYYSILLKMILSQFPRFSSVFGESLRKTFRMLEKKEKVMEIQKV